MSLLEPESAPSHLRLLLRLLEELGKGVRKPEILAGILDVPADEVRHMLRVGRCFGLIEEIAPFRLSRKGLSVAYGKRPRIGVLARRVLASPLAQGLTPSPSAPPPDDATLLAALRGRDPNATPRPASPGGDVSRDEPRLAASLRAVLLAALAETPKRPREATAVQLSLGLPRFRPPATSDRKTVGEDEADAEESPRLYRAVLQALLDEGELSMGHLRALLDEAGARRAPVGGYAQMALRRGDATRWADGAQDKLLVTRGAVERRDLSDTVVSIALSDPEYRAYLEIVRRCAHRDPAAALRYPRLRAQYERWDRCVFGPTARPMDIAEAMDRLLPGQPLGAFPLAGPAVDEEPAIVPGVFLDLMERRDLVVALPPSLELLSGGLTTVNTLLDERHRRPLRVGLPTLADTRCKVHGGLFHPGETPMRAIPDLVSLRMRLISNVPHFAFLCALLLLHRRSQGRVKVHFRRERLSVLLPGNPLGSLLLVADRWMRAQGWLVSRRFRGGLTEAALADISTRMGIAEHVHRRLLLSEDFFCKLKESAEEREMLSPLHRLADRLEGDLPALFGPLEAAGKS